MLQICCKPDQDWMPQLAAPNNFLSLLDCLHACGGLYQSSYTALLDGRLDSLSSIHWPVRPAYCQRFVILIQAATISAASYWLEISRSRLDCLTLSCDIAHCPASGSMPATFQQPVASPTPVAPPQQRQTLHLPPFHPISSPLRFPAPGTTVPHR